VSKVHTDLSNSLGNAANYLGTMLTGNGVPNDVIGNFNSLVIILMGPVLNVSPVHIVPVSLSDRRRCFQ
jgi:hypothetical protein